MGKLNYQFQRAESLLHTHSGNWKQQELRFARGQLGRARLRADEMTTPRANFTSSLRKEIYLELRHSTLVDKKPTAHTQSPATGQFVQISNV